MDKKRTFLICALMSVAAGALGAPVAAAQSLKSIRAQQAEQETLDNEIAFTNSVCGGNIAATINWSSASNWPENTSLASACDGALGALEAICRAPGGADKASKIKSFVCKGDSSGPSLSGGALSFGASPSESGFSDTKDYLEGKL